MALESNILRQMQQAFQYYTRFQSARGGVGALPPLARSLVMVFAIPGIVLLVLSILAGLISIFVLLLLTVPVYRILQAVFGGHQPSTEARVSENLFVSSLFGQVASPVRKQVEAKIVDAE